MLTKLNIYCQWIKSWKGFPIRSWIRAAELYKKGDFLAAKDLYIEGLRVHGAHAAAVCARMDLAYCHFRIGDIACAEQELREVVLTNPTMKEPTLRLARVLLWTGRPLEAAWILRKFIKRTPQDLEVIAAFLLAVVDGGTSKPLLKEALSLVEGLQLSDNSHPKIELAMAKLSINRGDRDEGIRNLARLSSGFDAPFDAVIAYAEALIEDKRIAHARQQLKRALMVAPQHPKVAGLFARSYLVEGPFYNCEFAIQLALSACKDTGWKGVKELHLLADAYYRSGDNLAALAAAHKAKNVGFKIIGGYHQGKQLDALIHSIESHGSEA